MVRGECSSAIELRIRLSVESAGLGHHLGDPFRPTLIPSHKRKRIPVLLRLSPRAASGQRGSAPLRERTQSRPGWVAALPGRRFGSAPAGISATKKHSVFYWPLGTVVITGPKVLHFYAGF